MMVYCYKVLVLADDFEVSGLFQECLDLIGFLSSVSCRLPLSPKTYTDLRSNAVIETVNLEF